MNTFTRIVFIAVLSRVVLAAPGALEEGEQGQGQAGECSASGAEGGAGGSAGDPSSNGQVGAGVVHSPSRAHTRQPGRRPRAVQAPSFSRPRQAQRCVASAARLPRPPHCVLVANPYALCPARRMTSCAPSCGS